MHTRKRLKKWKRQTTASRNGALFALPLRKRFVLTFGAFVGCPHRAALCDDATVKFEEATAAAEESLVQLDDACEAALCKTDEVLHEALDVLNTASETPLVSELRKLDTELADLTVALE